MVPKWTTITRIDNSHDDGEMFEETVNIYRIYKWIIYGYKIKIAYENYEKLQKSQRWRLIGRNSKMYCIYEGNANNHGIDGENGNYEN